jgi:cytochrome c oxidase cbb3-type subunit 4
MMDSALIGTVVTVVSFIIFIGIFIWAWSDRRKKDFDAAANLPFEEEAKPKHDANPRH